MRALVHNVFVRGLVVVIAVSAAPVVQAGKIDAVAGKKYELTKAHGPVMIKLTARS
jgi:hypothetical protein